MKPNYLDNPLAWGRTARIAQTPAEYAASIERSRSGLPFAKIASTIFAAAVALLAMVIVAHAIARSFP